jgi:hypothetical protein
MQVPRDGLAFFLTEHTGDCSVGGLVRLFVQYETRYFFALSLAAIPNYIVRALADRCGFDQYLLTIKLELKPVRGSDCLSYAGRRNGS